MNISELIHIWKCEPCEPGDTLCGGDVVQTLVKSQLIKKNSSGCYVTTSKGKKTVQDIVTFLEIHKQSVFEHLNRKN